jgi:hypothetical protein
VNLSIFVILASMRQLNLNWLLRIFSTLILCSRVDGGIRSLAAAPEGPRDSTSAFRQRGFYNFSLCMGLAFHRPGYLTLRWM